MCGLIRMSCTGPVFFAAPLKGGFCTSIWGTSCSVWQCGGSFRPSMARRDKRAPDLPTTNVPRSTVIDLAIFVGKWGRAASAPVCMRMRMRMRTHNQMQSGHITCGLTREHKALSNSSSTHLHAWGHAHHQTQHGHNIRGRQCKCHIMKGSSHFLPHKPCTHTQSMMVCCVRHREHGATAHRTPMSWFTQCLPQPKLVGGSVSWGGLWREGCKACNDSLPLQGKTTSAK